MRMIDTFFVDGNWRRPAGQGRLPVVNPATDETIAEVPCCSDADVDRAVAAARGAYAGWAATSPSERKALLTRIQDGIKARADEMAATITAEMGAPLGFSKAAQVGLPLRNLATTMDAMTALADERIGSSIVCRDPVGVVAAITPWNFPLHQIVAKIVPALAAGCTVVLKPSEVTPLNAYLLTEIVEAAGVPSGVFNLLPGDADTGAALVGHDGVDMVSFTGSTRAGRKVAGLAAHRLKKVALELGGKSANIVLPDADFERAIPAAVAQCFINSGQVCAALSRLLVPADRLREVEEMAVAAAAGWILGDPLDPATKLGPLASRVQQARVRFYIEGAIAEGARLLSGGAGQPQGFSRGAYVSPTLFSGVDNAMAIGREEVFGPVLSIMTYRDEDDAVRRANDSDYGLSGGVWSSDSEHAMAVAKRMRTGQVVVNGAMLDLAAPFGGVKQSGLGREYGRYGLEEFTALKSVSGISVDANSAQIEKIG